MFLPDYEKKILDNIRENSVVSYDVEEGRKGPNAVNVKVA